MRIAIVGTGHIGSTLARHFVDVGHEVVLSNSRGPDSLSELVAELGPRASAATAADAVRAGDLIVVSVPLKNYREVPTDGIDDKVVIDTMNYYPARDGRFAAIESGEVGSSELLAQHLGSRRVVKVFNTIVWDRLRDAGKPQGSPGRIALPLSGDDPTAKSIVAELVSEIGFEAIDVGGLSAAGRKQQPGGPLYSADLSPAELLAAAEG
jgi:8-hydroxy-5-deazaflavin:NADPH oxidoreductase